MWGNRGVNHSLQPRVGLDSSCQEVLGQVRLYREIKGDVFQKRQEPIQRHKHWKQAPHTVYLRKARGWR